MKKLKITFNSPVVLTLVLLSVLATALGYITDGMVTRRIFMTYRSDLLSPMTWIRSITHIFGHADWSHLTGNMAYLLLLGPMLEEKYTSKILIEVIVITALVTSLINSIFFPNIALCGASGVVFAFVLLSSFTSFKEGEIPITFILVAIFFIGQQVVDGLMFRDNISNMAHIVGGIVGSFIGYKWNCKYIPNTY